MELLRQVSSTQFLFPAAAVAVVLVCAALVFIFGFHSAEQPQFDKLPLVVDDRKSSKSKRKTKDKKSSPNRTASDDGKGKSESSKKSPAKEKKKEEVKEEKQKPKERPVEPKPVKKEAPVDKKGKKKGPVETEKPADFDEGIWEEVPKKVKPSEKKKANKEEPAKKEKESPSKKNKKIKAKEADVEAAHPPAEESSEETIKVVSTEGPEVSEEATRALQAQVEELQRILKERERRDQAASGGGDDSAAEAEVEELTDVKDLRSNKKKEIKEKQDKKKKEVPVKSAPKPEPEKDDEPDIADDKSNAPVFDELGDTWTDAKAAKKGKKKARKDQ